MCFRHKNPPPMSVSLFKSTEKFLIQATNIVVEGNHKRRLQVLSGMIASCMFSKSSSYEGLSNSDKPSAEQSESRVKQAKRWLSSKWTDWDSFYAPYIKVLLRNICISGELVLIIDGSEMAGDCTVLMLSVMWKNYAIPLVWLAKQGKKGCFPENMHLSLIELAYSIIPKGCRVVLLGDGEFDGTELCKKCEEQEWEFVLRTSLDRKIDENGQSVSMGELSPHEGSEVVFIESALNGYNAVLWHYKKYDSPIPLLTNMELGEMACCYYERRFKIELLFKQMKSAGFNVHKSKINGVVRIKNLIIVLAIAFLFIFCTGLFIKKMPHNDLKKFLRTDRIANLTPINIALKAINHDIKHLILILSNMSRNFPNFFSGFD